ncbi:acyltransferase [Mesorhizobium sp. M0387]|uniref:acyltransferase family protein n=1 Tax=Mesorhizobium sp. M0387 TaxID=2956940 RepID=UPI0033372CB2
MTSTNRLKGLQALRGIAALLVVTMHAMNLAAAYSGAAWARSASGIVAHLGHWGVDIFFVLSGFVIAGLAGKSGASGGFLVKRAARVFPLFWLSLAAMLLLPPLPGADNSGLSIKPLSLLLLQVPTAHPVAWTLTYEVQFYLVAAIAIMAGVNFRWAFGVWIMAEAVLVAASIYGLVPKFPLTDALTLEFCMGVALAIFGQGAIVRRPFVLVAFAILAVAGSSMVWGSQWVSTTTPVRALVWGVPAAMLVWAVLTAEEQGVKFPRSLTFLGDISYSVYMWHLAVFSVAAAILGYVHLNDGTTGAALFLGFGLVGVLGVGALSYSYFERPITRLAGRGRAIPLVSRAAHLSSTS